MYMDLSLSVRRNNDNFSYTVGLSKAGFTTFEKLDDLWKFMEDVHHECESQDVADKDKIVLVLQKDIMFKDIAPVIKKLTAFGYKILFAYIS